jgi:hypothetical protein
MENIIREILIAAQSLDNRGLVKEAKELDLVSDSLVRVKTAQYDGTQGYFIRNNRCWNGCVRTKRADGKTPHEAWSECHEEWLGSSVFGSGDESWDKYADSGDSEMQKVAFSNDPIVAKASNVALHDAIKDRIKNGIEIEDAIPMTLAERSMSIASDLEKCAKAVDDLAQRVGVEGIADSLKDVSIKISNISADEYVKSVLF